VKDQGNEIVSSYLARIRRTLPAVRLIELAV